MNTVEGYCVSDEELREEFIADLAQQVVQYASDLVAIDKGLSFNEWHKLLDEVVIVIASHKASDAVTEYEWNEIYLERKI